MTDPHRPQSQSPAPDVPPQIPPEIRKVALVVSDFEGGGVERTFTHLAAGLSRLGVETLFLVGDPQHPFLSILGEGVRVEGATADRTAMLADIIGRERPDILVTGKLADDYAALEARDRLGSQTGAVPPTRLVAAVGTPLSGRFAGHRWNLLKTLRDTRRIGACYRRLDGIAAISEGVAEDLRRVFRVTQVPIRVLVNPTLADDTQERAALPCPHPWLDPDSGDCGPPVILAVGGLRKVKDFPMLIRAFARLPEGSARLLILGEGKQRPRLARLIDRLGLRGRADLPGFVADPIPYMARSRVLALSSTREGLGNAAIEALAVGTPVVATDCSAGLRKVFADGRLGPLLPVGDPDAFARGLERALRVPPDRAALTAAAGPYRILPAVRDYLTFFRELAAWPRSPRPGANGPGSGPGGQR